MSIFRVVLVFCSAALLAGCFDFNAEERAEVRVQLAQVEARIDSAQADLTSARSRLGSIENDIAQTRRNLAAYENEVKAIMRRYPEAVAAIGAGMGGASVAIDANSEYSEEAESIGAGVALVAGLYALGNQEEVGYVAGVMSDADRDTNNMKAKIASLERDLVAQESVVTQKQSSLIVVTNEHEALTQRLLELQ